MSSVVAEFLPPVGIACDDEECTSRIVRALEESGFPSGHVALDPLELALPTERDGLAPVVISLDRSPTRRVRALRDLVARGTHVRAVVCQDSGSAEVRRMVTSGASGFVLTSELETTLGPTLRAVLAGQIAVPGDQRLQVGRPQLSAREKQILGLVVMGFMNCEIASQLFLAESTIKSHLSSAFLKLGVRSRSEAVDLILDAEQGLGRGILAITSDQPQYAPPTSA
jgi:DNA-binding NarL/FixJ family response regulator